MPEIREKRRLIMEKTDGYAYFPDSQNQDF